MSSMASDSSSIQVSCKQTRFQVDNLSHREIDVEGLSISASAISPKGKAKAKARSTGTEILKDLTGTDTTDNAEKTSPASVQAETQAAAEEAR